MDDDDGDARLMDAKPEPGRVESRRELPNVGVTVVRFANGVEAWLKPTDFKNDQVLFTMDALGGASLAPPADFLEASLSAGYVAASGVGRLKALDMQRLLAGKLASATPFMGLSTHGFSGSATPAELETALQILYQRFTAPGDDPDAFALLKRQLDASSVNREQSPGRVFGERLAQVNTSNHYTAQPLTPERVAALDRAKMVAFYRERFSNAADFTFFMVGAFKVDEVVPLLAQYVGSLPSTGKATSQFKDVGIHFPDGVKRDRVEKGREPKSQTVISFFADPDRDAVEQEKILATNARARDRPARHPARGPRPDLHRVGRARPGAAAARRRAHRGELRRRAREHSGRFVMSKAKRLAAILVGTALLGSAFAGLRVGRHPVSFGAHRHGDLAGGRRDGGRARWCKEGGLDDHHLGGQQRPGSVQLPARQNGTRQIRGEHPGRRI